MDDNGTPGDPTDDTVIYTPTPGFVGYDTFTYTIVDTSGDRAAAAVTVTITNAPPIVQNDTVSTSVDTPVTVTVTDNDSDVDGTIDPTTVDLDPNIPGQQTTFAVAGQGTFTADGSGNVTFTPEPGFIGMSATLYTIDDDTHSTSAPATLTVTVIDDLNPPVAVNDIATTAIDTPIIIPVLNNDSDPDSDPLRIVQVSTPPTGTVTINAEGTLTYTPAPDSTDPVIFTYTITDDRGGTAVATVTVNLTFFAPPIGQKILMPVSLTELEARIVWINNGNVTVNRVHVVDPIPVETTFVPGSLTCEARGASTVERCEFDAVRNEVVYEGTMAMDFGAVTEGEAANEVVLTFRLALPSGFYGDVVNQAVANWDVNGNGLLAEELETQEPVVTDDPATTDGDDATTSVVPVPPGACLFQVRESGEGEQQDTESPDPVDNPVEGGLDAGATQQASTPELALTTPQPNQVIAGTAVAVAAVQLPGQGASVSTPVPVLIANHDLDLLPDIVEDQGFKTEILPTQPDHVVVTAAGVLVVLPAGTLAQEETLDIATVAVADAPTPLPGTAVADIWRFAVGQQQEDVAIPVTLRLPYADADQDGRVDAINPVIEATTLTLWRYEAAAGWERLPDAVVIPTANVLVVQTTQLVLFGIFRAADGSLGPVGNSNDDVDFPTATPTGATATHDSAWLDIGLVAASPLFVTAWDTTQFADGAYEVRAVCADSLAALADFQGTPAAAGSGGSGGCFIATAAYGSPLAPQIQVLRDFRDTYLLTHALGRWFVGQYARLSPPLADIIRDRAWLRAAVRVSLAPVVWVARVIMHPIGWLVGILIGGSLLSALGWYARRRLRSA